MHSFSHVLMEFTLVMVGVVGQKGEVVATFFAVIVEMVAGKRKMKKMMIGIGPEDQ